MEQHQSSVLTTSFVHGRHFSESQRNALSTHEVAERLKFSRAKSICGR